jgi:hypothetical protein
VGLTSSTRRSGLAETSSQSVSLSELDSIDVFDFFNYFKAAEPEPRSTAAPAGGGQTSILLQRGFGPDVMRNGGAAVPDPEEDWLGYRSQFN